MLKKILTIFLSLSLSASVIGCAQSAPNIEEAEEHTYYFTAGRYYTEGIVITEDGNEWSYTQDIISEKSSYNYEPVFVGFDDNATPNDIYDDSIVGLVLDKETEIYDALEASLATKFHVERTGNNITIHAEQ